MVYLNTDIPISQIYPQIQENEMKQSRVIYRKVTESRLDVAQRLVYEEIDSLANSAPRATLLRLEQIAKALESIECSL